MNKVNVMYYFGTVGSFIASIFGGWTTSLKILCILMVIDYFTGLATALFFKTSTKGDGTYDSSIGAKGLVRKIMIIVLVYVAHCIDMALGTNYLRDGVAIAFMVNEALSIIENAGQMGIPIPDVLAEGISVLKSDKKDSKEDKGE